MPIPIANGCGLDLQKQILVAILFTFKTSPDLGANSSPTGSHEYSKDLVGCKDPAQVWAQNFKKYRQTWGFPHLRWSSNCPVCCCEGSGCVSEMWSKVKSEAKNELGIPYTSYHGIPMLNQCQPARDTRHAQHVSFLRLVFFCPDGRFHFYSHTQTITRRCLDADAWWILEVLGAHGRIWKAGKEHLWWLHVDPVDVFTHCSRNAWNGGSLYTIYIQLCFCVGASNLSPFQWCHIFLLPCVVTKNMWNWRSSASVRRHVQKVITIQRYARGFLVRLRMWRQARGVVRMITRMAGMMFIEKFCYLEGLGGLKPW